MKILFLDHSTFVGGAEKSLVSIAKNIRYKSHVLCFSKGDFTDLLHANDISYDLIENAIRINHVNKKNPFKLLLKSSLSIIKTILEIRQHSKGYDVIYSNTFKTIFFGFFATVFTKKKWIVHIRDILSSPSYKGLPRKLFRIVIFFKKPIFISNSIASRNALFEIGISRKVKSYVVYNGVEFNDSKFEKPKGKTNNKIIIGIFSRITPWKGHHVLLDAFAKLNYSDFELWVVGKADTQDLEYEKNLKKTVNAQNLDNVIFWGFQDNPIQIMSSIDILVLPSIEPEPFGRVVIEAMMLGKVVIATNHGGPCEIINHNVDGLLVNPTSDSLVDALKLFTSKDNHYETISGNAKNKYQACFTENVLIKNIEKIIDENSDNP